jgi:threonine aldolase
VIAGLLHPYEGVVAAETGHIAAHEAGAIENSGHKVLPIPQTLGKITADDLTAYLNTFYADDNCDHMVQPGMVYISHPTEYGTLYTKDELAAIHAAAKAYDLPLFIDGARLGYGLASDGTDLSLPEIAQNCDAFYIGGTKVGALCGEAVVFPRGNAPKHFFTTVKQNGALLAKGRLLGVQFDALLEDDLYFKIAGRADALADKIRASLAKAGYPLAVEGITNQIFPILPDKVLAELEKKYVFCPNGRIDETHSSIRICTSWATTQEAVDALCADLEKVYN